MLTLLSAALPAQEAKLEITPSYGYTFSSRNNYAYGELDLEDNYSAGLALDIRVHRDMLVELSYSNYPTEMTAEVYNGIYGKSRYVTPVSVQYYMIGGMREFSDEKVKPFTSLSLGGALLHPTGNTEGTDFIGNTAEISYGDQWAFSAALGGGAKIMFNDRIGLRLQGRLLLPMYFNGVGIYCGGGCGGGASFGVYFVQLELSGGIIIALGQSQ